METEPTNSSAPDPTPNELPESVADMPLNVHVTLGRTSVPLKDVFKITIGSVIELAQPADEPAELVANGKTTARGRLVIVRGNYGLKVIAKVADDKSGR
jgi:flagellar motor switch protein FliN/FliY